MAPPSIPQGQPIHIPIPPPPPPYTSGINQIFWALFIIIYLITQKEYWCSILSILFQLWIEIVFTDNLIWFYSFNVSTSTSYTSHRDSSASLFNQVTKCVRICLTEIGRTFKIWCVIKNELINLGFLLRFRHPQAWQTEVLPFRPESIFITAKYSRILGSWISLFSKTHL